MMWLLGGVYCLVLWLVFAKWKLLRLSLPVAIVAAAIGPTLILVLLFCAQYYHVYSKDVRVFQKVVPVIPQMKQPGRVTRIGVRPNVPVKTGEVLFEVDRIPFQLTVDRLTASLTENEQDIRVAESSIDLAKATQERATADLTFMASERDRYQKLVEKGGVSQEAYERTLAQHQQASSAMVQANVSLKQAELSVGLAKARLAQTQASLADSKYDLEQTIVRAPSDGYVTNLQLQPGMLVGGPGASSVMSFVQDRTEEERGVVVVLVSQKNYLLIEPGQYAEVVFNGYPGRVFTGRVLTTIDVSGTGQLTATGDLPEDLGPTAPARFAVRIKLDVGDKLRIPAGANGLAAVYTQHVPIAGIPVMVVIRMQSWLKYVL
jgi:multidrug resistance efflux pump